MVIFGHERDQQTIACSNIQELPTDRVDDLGYHASDILQANAVVWVEGPSDRIYLNHWIRAFDERLHEGIHYTIMFYGGALIRHLTASDDVLKEFITLRDLNRNMAIVLDSDRGAAISALKPHAQRLVDDMGNFLRGYADGAFDLAWSAKAARHLVT